MMEGYAQGDGFAKWHGILRLMEPKSEEAARDARPRANPPPVRQQLLQLQPGAS